MTQTRISHISSLPQEARTTVQRVHRSVDGLRISIQGIDAVQGGFTHGFVVEFNSIDDRNFYVSSDHVHQSFVKKNGSKFEDVRVIDYEKGVY